MRRDRVDQRGPVPGDVRKAIAVIRRGIDGPLCMADLAAQCGVAERTLNEHFRTFVGLSPISYLRRLRLAAAREALLAAGPDTSVTEVARRYCFNHAGRFSAQYRRHFGETPSATLRRRRPAAGPGNGDDATARPAVASRDHLSIAVLPGAAPTGEPTLRWQAEAIAEAIAAALSAIRSLRVVVPAPARAATRDPHRLAREMGARYLLTGRVVQDGARLRFILRVADAVTGHHVWGDSFDGHSERPLALQDRIVAGVLRNIAAGIRGAEIERACQTAPRDLDAHGLAMRALPLLYSSTPEAARRALDGLHRAIRIDPDFALARALAAWGHAQLVMYNGASAPEAEKEQARRLVELAVTLGDVDDGDPLGLTARCAVHMMTGELDAAEALVARALAQDPACGWAWGRSGWLHAYRGEPETAIAHFRRALMLKPGAARANLLAGIGSAHFHAGRYAAAAACLRRALLKQPNMAWANRSLSVAYARLGDRRKALESLEALRRFRPDLTVGRVVTAVPFQPDFLDRLGDGLSALGLPP